MVLAFWMRARCANNALGPLVPTAKGVRELNRVFGIRLVTLLRRGLRLAVLDAANAFIRHSRECEALKGSCLDDAIA
jgi:hypothetical protein